MDNTTLNIWERVFHPNHVRDVITRIEALHGELNQALYEEPDNRPRIQSPADVASLLYHLNSLDREEFYVILLDARNRVIRFQRLYSGCVNCSNVRIAEVLRQPIVDNAAAIIIAHNHPSGDVTPSPDDIRVTRAVGDAGHLFDIDLLDSLVIGGGRYYSIKEHGHSLRNG